MNDLDQWNIYIDDLSFAGVDFGLSPLAATSDGKLFHAGNLIEYVIGIKSI